MPRCPPLRFHVADDRFGLDPESMIFPNSWQISQALHADTGDVMCCAHFGGAPSSDRIYVSDIRAAPNWRGAGVAYALMVHVAQVNGHQVPITPIYETDSARCFYWHRLRAATLPGWVGLYHHVRHKGLINVLRYGVDPRLQETMDLTSPEEMERERTLWAKAAG
jgi:hypothetical protein